MSNYRFNEEVKIELQEDNMVGNLFIARKPHAIIVFAHGSGSSNSSSRNEYFAAELQKAGFSTLLFDIMSIQAEPNFDNRLDIEVEGLTKQLLEVTDWLQKYEHTSSLALGYLATAAGAGSALRAAASLGSKIGAVVCRGGRPDLAEPLLCDVQCPTLLVVGEHDKELIDCNQSAFSTLGGKKQIKIVRGAGNLFDEPGKLEKVAVLATKWFEKYLA